MRVIAKSTLRAFWEQGHDSAETPLTEWYNMMLRASWTTPQELKADIGTASILKYGRAVFNIGGNKYRVIVSIRYSQQIAWVRFVGTHAQYDLVDAETV
ncbi:type II toxin-antitoxin system HigB family toxin [Salinicola sp. LHM]|uniref:type II toxin-antitoxin system HigB family toxin n=1 Tax=Salinicola sp. LHM TaxID=3065298 RepID=UPI002ACD91B4|nr:type II toxin-antitoxin system HigB family toxin [Salinicola sp. LHM]MED5501044.1 type II toxin-antitoxin system HigB family toxin [Pseudomonadota bacterium]WQH33187.1 type II toxin-antitoxin system HigB family toxin [Salinicola sp. LHM]